VRRPEAVRWHTTTRVVEVGGHALDLILLDGFEANVAHDARRRRGRPDPRPGADISPMFGVVWPGARTLGTRLATGPDLTGTTLLELGCGLAIPAWIAARRGARVVATDVHPDAGTLLAANAVRLGLDVTWARWDWRDDPPPAVAAQRFDRVLASDVLYDGALAEPLARALATTLAPDGEAWLTDPGRPWLDRFLDAAADHGLDLTEDLSTTGDDVVHDIRLWHAGSR